MTGNEQEERLRELQDVLRRGASSEAWDAMPEVLDRLGPLLRRRLRRRFRLASDESDDVLSNALVRLYENRSKLRPEGSLAGYLLRIVDRLAIDKLRRPQEEDASVLDLAGSGEEQPGPPSAGALGIVRALDQIDPTDAAILRAFSRSDDSDNWTQAIAQELGLTANAVRVRKHRALERLKHAYLAQHPAPRVSSEEDT